MCMPFGRGRVEFEGLLIQYHMFTLYSKGHFHIPIWTNKKGIRKQGCNGRECGICAGPVLLVFNNTHPCFPSQFCITNELAFLAIFHIVFGQRVALAEDWKVREWRLDGVCFAFSLLYEREVSNWLEDCQAPISQPDDDNLIWWALFLIFSVLSPFFDIIIQDCSCW